MRIVKMSEVKIGTVPLYKLGGKPELLVEYGEYAAGNSDPYANAVLRYASAYGKSMENAIANGKSLESAISTYEHICDDEGISGFMFGCAMKELAYFWEHGEELRKIHNLKTQIGTEGERANESGGILNPAMLCFGARK